MRLTKTEATVIKIVAIVTAPIWGPIVLAKKAIKAVRKERT